MWAGAAATPAAANTAVVGNCLGGTAKYTTIGAAISATPAGGTVNVCPGNYPEQVVITKTLTLTNVPGFAAPVVKSPIGGVVSNAFYLIDPTFPIAVQILVKKTSGVNISNLTVDGSNNGIAACAPDFIGIYFQNASGTVSGVTLQKQQIFPQTALGGCQSGQGIYVESGYGSAGSSVVQISNSTISAYQKNGITADGSATNVSMIGNVITGIGPVPNVAAENGIQVSDGAAGYVFANTVQNNVYGGYNPPTNPYLAAGIYVSASNGVNVSSNTLNNNQVPIATQSYAAYGTVNNVAGTADNTTIAFNVINTSPVSDGIDVCSDSNFVQGNVMTNTFQSGVHLDGTCTGADTKPTGKNNFVSGNVVNGSCTTILEGNTPNTLLANLGLNVRSQLTMGDTCAQGPPANPTPIPWLPLQGIWPFLTPMHPHH
jgi:hypothetical protein